MSNDATEQTIEQDAEDAHEAAQQDAADEQAAAEADAAEADAEAEQATNTPGSDGAEDAANATLDAGHWAAIVQARDDEREAEEAVEELKEELAGAKKRLEACSYRLGKLIDEAKYPNLFTGVTPSADSTSSAADDTAEQAAPDAWRAVPLADIGLDAKVVAKLAAHTPALTTMGELADFTAGERNRVTDVKGIGEKAAEAIEAATLRWHQEHPTSEPAKANAEPLVWGTDDDGNLYAPNTAGIEVEGDLLAEFVITGDDGNFELTASAGALMPDEDPGDFNSLVAAKAWCETRNAALLAKRAGGTTVTLTHVDGKPVEPVVIVA